MTDPWAAASVATAPTAPTQVQQPQAGQGGQGQGGGALSGAFASGGSGTALFGQGSLAPSLFNKTHFVGTEREGIITKAPYEQQSRDFNSKMPKYWSASKVGGDTKNRAVTTDAIDGPTGRPNRPVMDVLIELNTEYGPLSPQEMAAVGREPGQEGDGRRVYAVAGKEALESFRKAIAEFNQRVKSGAEKGPQLTCEDDTTGLKLRVKRSGQKPNQGGNASWLYETHLSRP
jgi:hypothetical protein